MSEVRRFLGVRMDAQRADALRIVAARHRISLSELMCRAAEAQYGNEIDEELSQLGLTVVSSTQVVRSATVVAKGRAS